MRKSRKNPVLTSPWKIGIFVALMLAVTSTGVGYYFVDFYDIDLSWLGSGESKWVVDSWGFFKETYPLAAGVVMISLMTYFIIASAVRRYRFYLSSGEDYRKMISLADSIDDLTNPAQIARLGDFPELQDILRSYGDQIKEISEEMGSRESERSVELEMEVESILAGEDSREEVAEGKWWAPIVYKVNQHMESGREELARARSQAEAGRRATAQASLSLGVVMESLGGSSEDLMDIARNLGSLNSTISEIEASASHEGPSGAMSGTDGQLGESLELLQKSSRTLREFSEENNGLALNIALMAARGDVSEHDLAQFAEKVRSTAERFNKLGVELSEAASRISAGAGEGRDASGARPGAADRSGIAASLKEISDNIDRKTQSLQEKMTGIGHEVDSLVETLQKSMPEKGVSLDSKDPGCAESEPLVNFGGGVQDDSAEEELVLDRSNIWEADNLAPAAGGESDAGEGPSAVTGGQALAPDPGMISFEDEKPGAPLPGAGETKDSAGPDVTGDPGSRSFDVGETAGDRPAVEEAPAAEETPSASPAGPRAGDDMMEMPGHRWVKIGAEGQQDTETATDGPAGDAEDDVMDIDPSSELVGDDCDTRPDPTEDLMDRVAETIRGVTGMEDDAHDPEEIRIQDESGDDGEPVYDLFELGATEYVEETPGL